MVLGQIKKLEVSFEDTTGSFKFNNDPSNTLELNALTIFVGVNGSGKSMILKLNWLANFVTFSNLIAKESEIEKEYVGDDYFMQMCFEKTFRDAEDLKCKLKAYFSCGSTMSFEYDKGTILQYDINFAEDVDDGIKPIYMSSVTRLLSSIEDYIEFKKDLRERFDTQEEIIAKKMLEKYILPDLTYLEFRSHQLSEGITVPTDLGERFVKDFEFDFKPLLVYLEDDKIHIRTDKGVKKVRSLGAGHQALLTMMLPIS
jgi:ABC-type dipeptide/oligopeptide/nickel transport system ATPase component